MKYKFKKNAFTLAEMLVSLAILSIIFVGIFSFLTGAFTKLVYEDSKIVSFEEIISVQNTLKSLYDEGYKEISILDYENGNLNKVVLMKHSDTTKGAMLVGVVAIGDDATSGVLQPEYVYGDNYLGYRKITTDELTDIETNFTDITFFRDNIFTSLRVKNFIPTLYNEGKILDIDLEVTHLSIEALKNKSFDDISDRELYLQKYNLIF